MFSSGISWGCLTSGEKTFLQVTKNVVAKRNKLNSDNSLYECNKVSNCRWDRSCKKCITGKVRNWLQWTRHVESTLQTLGHACGDVRTVIMYALQGALVVFRTVKHQRHTDEECEKGISLKPCITIHKLHVNLSLTLLLRTINNRLDGA